MFEIESIHHVSLPVSDLAASQRFYEDVLGLRKIDRPDFPFPGAWYAVGHDRQLHLIQDDAAAKHGTFRSGKSVDSRDIHFAIRVRDFEQAVEHLRLKGYGEAAEDDLMELKINRQATAGFPQLYLLDPDRHVIEINAKRLR